MWGRWTGDNYYVFECETNEICREYGFVKHIVKTRNYLSMDVDETRYKEDVDKEDVDKDDKN